VSARLAEPSATNRAHALFARETPLVPDTISPEILYTIVDSFLQFAPIQASVSIGGMENAAVPAPEPTVPTFYLRGTVGGPPWTALISGVPGRDGDAALHVGDSIGNVRIVGISRVSM